MEERRDAAQREGYFARASRRSLLWLRDYISTGIQTYKAYRTRPRRLPDGTRVHVLSDHFEEECEGVITKGHYDEGWLYRIDVTSGDRLDSIRHADGELWVCDFEAHSMEEGKARDDRTK